jgi:hypothetical protein
MDLAIPAGFSPLYHTGYICIDALGRDPGSFGLLCDNTLQKSFALQNSIAKVDL